jgi:polyhydroxybutyrate depolymerase
MKPTVFVTLLLMIVGSSAFYYRHKSPVYHVVRHVIVSDNAQREYFLYAPASRCTRVMPLVVVLHSGGGPLGTAESMAEHSGWEQVARGQCVIIAFPQGELEDPSRALDLSAVGSTTRNIRTWNDGVGVTASSQRRVDDVKFIDAVIDEVSAQEPVDANRIYATGFSDGATMSYRLGVDLSGKVAAIAPVAGVLYAEPSGIGTVSLLSISGESDPLPTYTGTNARKSPIVKDPVAVWADTLSCPKSPLWENSDTVAIQRFPACRGQAEVIQYLIKGMGHMYPGHTDLFGSPHRVGSDIDATGIIWNFFQEHPKNATQ